jgi:hypothetical protein
MPRSKLTISALVTVIVVSFIGALVQLATFRLANHLENNFGYSPNPAGLKEFLGELKEPTFAQAGADAVKQAKGKDVYLYRYADQAHRKVYGTPFEAWNQGNAGTCVSFGWGLGAYIGQSVDYATGSLPNAPLECDTSGIYGGSRTAGRMPPVNGNAGFSDGSYGAAAARWVAGKCKQPGIGGILYKQKYGSTDLTNYSIPRSREWGNSGVPLDLAKEANKHTAKAVAQVSTWEELSAALESGYCVPICSNVGFAATNVRDEDGLLPRGSQWSHCMLIAGIRHAANASENGMKRPRDCALIVNSWGTRWVVGGKLPADQPDGSFWAERKDVEAILAQGDSFAIGGVNGFAYRDLDHGGWLQPGNNNESK